MVDAAVVMGLLGVALVGGWVARTQKARSTPTVDVSGLAPGPAVVIFTRDDCPNCPAALERASALGLSVRRVRAEDEPGELARRGVEGVPITVVIGRDGRVHGQFGGVPPLRRLRRSARRASEIPDGGARDL